MQRIFKILLNLFLNPSHAGVFTCEPSVSNSYQTPWNREQQDVWYTPIPPNDKGGSDNNGNPSEPRDEPKSPGGGTKGSSNENSKEEGHLQDCASKT